MTGFFNYPRSERSRSRFKKLLISGLLGPGSLCPKNSNCSCQLHYRDISLCKFSLPRLKITHNRFFWLLIHLILCISPCIPNCNPSCMAASGDVGLQFQSWTILAGATVTMLDPFPLKTNYLAEFWLRFSQFIQYGKEKTSKGGGGSYISNMWEEELWVKTRSIFN